MTEQSKTAQSEAQYGRLVDVLGPELYAPVHQRACTVEGIGQRGEGDDAEEDSDKVGAADWGSCHSRPLRGRREIVRVRSVSRTWRCRDRPSTLLGAGRVLDITGISSEPKVA